MSAVGIERYVRSNESFWLDYRIGARLGSIGVVLAALGRTPHRRFSTATTPVIGVLHSARLGGWARGQVLAVIGQAF